MKPIHKTIISVCIILILLIPIAMAKENSEYVCIEKDKDIQHSPPTIAIESQIDQSQIESQIPPLCTNGKIPKAVINKKLAKELKDAAKIKKIPKIESTISIYPITTAECIWGACYNWAGSGQYVDNIGSYSVISQHSPYVNPINGFHSLTEMAVINDKSKNIVEVGWTKYPFTKTQLFTFWWKNDTPQCYNSGCGWVQYSNTYYPGMSISTTGVSKDYAIQYYQGNWWIWYSGQWIGYYPGSLWNGNFKNSNRIEYFGEVASRDVTTTTDMGNGLWASNYGAAKITSQQYLIDSTWIYANTYKYATAPNLYSISWTSFSSIRYGGPGSG